MRLDNFIEGLEILQRYFDDPGHELGAEHDQIYVYATLTAMTNEDVKRLHELGWFQENTEEYDPHEGWTCYV